MTKTVNIELFVQQDLECGEGPVWDHDMQCLYWTDSGATKIFAAHENNRLPQEIADGMHAASLTLNENGGIVFCGKQGFHYIDASGKVKNLAGLAENIPVVNVNDIIADAGGRIFGGQDAFRENAPYNTGYLFQIDTSGNIRVLEEGLHLSNGMGFSPASDKFYLVDSIVRNIYVYDYDLLTGNIANRKILITLDKNDGLPDGMTVDEEGFIWVARWFGNGVSRYDPDGKLERIIELPVSQPSSLTFGGADYNHLFITSARVKWTTPLAPDDHHFSGDRGGGVYRVILDIKGRPEHRAKI